MHFKQSLEDQETGELESKIFMDFISSYEEQFCIREGDSGLNTFDQVKKNSIFLKLQDDLRNKLLEIMEDEEEMAELLRPYTDIESEVYITMCDKVACLLTNKS
jgi:hypothetical protein